MAAIVSAETLLLVLLLVLVTGLLRSHAAILRRLGPLEEGPSPADEPRPAYEPAPPAVGAPRRDVPAPSIAGLTPAGDAIKLDFEGRGGSPTLLAFLGTGCGACETFWAGPGDESLPTGVRTVIVTHGLDRESPSRLRRLATAGMPVVMSSAAFSDYGVPGTPYFVLVEGHVRGAGAATNWRALSSLVTDAIADARDAATSKARDAATSHGGPLRRTIDETLVASGIGPDHPSLYPSRSPVEADWHPAA